MNQLKSQLHILHVLKNAKPQARRVLLASAGDDMIKANVECAINNLNGNHNLNKEDESQLCKYKNRLRALIDPNFSFKIIYKLLILKRRVYSSTAHKYFVGCNRNTN